MHCQLSPVYSSICSQCQLSRPASLVHLYSRAFPQKPGSPLFLRQGDTKRNEGGHYFREGTTGYDREETLHSSLALLVHLPFLSLCSGMQGSTWLCFISHRDLDFRLQARVANERGWISLRKADLSDHISQPTTSQHPHSNTVAPASRQRHVLGSGIQFWPTLQTLIVMFSTENDRIHCQTWLKR